MFKVVELNFTNENHWDERFFEEQRGENNIAGFREWTEQRNYQNWTGRGSTITGAESWHKALDNIDSVFQSITSFIDQRAEKWYKKRVLRVW